MTQNDIYLFKWLSPSLPEGVMITICHKEGGGSQVMLWSHCVHGCRAYWLEQTHCDMCCWDCVSWEIQHLTILTALHMFDKTCLCPPLQNCSGNQGRLCKVFVIVVTVDTTDCVPLTSHIDKVQYVYIYIFLLLEIANWISENPWRDHHGDYNNTLA